MLGIATNMNVWVALIVFIVQIGQLQCERESTNDEIQAICRKNLWSVYYDKSFREGEAMLRFNIPYNKEKGGGSGHYDAILACEGLLVNGTGHHILRIKKLGKNSVAFRVKLPEPKNKEEDKHQSEENNHTCIFELRHRTKKKRIYIQCQFAVKTLLHRILPDCNLKKNKRVLRKVEMLKDEAEVQLYFKHSPNDVATIDSNCDTGNLLGHDSFKTMQEEMFALNLPGTPNNIVDVEFFPPCELMNDTLKEHYMHHRMDDCHMEIYVMCQEGSMTIEEFKLEFYDEAMHCYPPKPKYIEFLEHLELQFMIESKPVVALLCVLIANGILYVLLIPFTIAKVFRTILKKVRKLEEHIAKRYMSWKSKGNRGGGKVPEETKLLLEDFHTATISEAYTTHKTSNSPDMEFDDLETVLLGKLSAQDFQDVNESISLEHSIPTTTVEVKADIEPVIVQPTKVDDELLVSDEHKHVGHKRRKSSLKHKGSSKDRRHSKSLTRRKSKEKKHSSKHGGQEDHSNTMNSEPLVDVSSTSVSDINVDIPGPNAPPPSLSFPPYTPPPSHPLPPHTPPPSHPLPPHTPPPSHPPSSLSLHPHSPLSPPPHPPTSPPQSLLSHSPPRRSSSSHLPPPPPSPPPPPPLPPPSQPSLLLHSPPPLSPPSHGHPPPPPPPPPLVKKTVTPLAAKPNRYPQPSSPTQPDMMYELMTKLKARSERQPDSSETQPDHKADSNPPSPDNIMQELTAKLRARSHKEN